MTSPLRRIVCLIVYAAMCVGGAAVVAVQLFISPVIVNPILAAAAVLMCLGGYMIWEDFLRPKPTS